VDIQAATVDIQGGPGVSTVIGEDGSLWITYFSHRQGVKIMRCSDPSCASATSSVLAPSSAGSIFNPLSSTALAIGSDGLALVAYKLNLPDGLVVAHCSNPECTEARTHIVDPDRAGDDVSMAIGTDGLALIAYAGRDFDIKVAHCEDPACSTASTRGLDGHERAWGTSIAIGSDGLGIIAYRNNADQLKVAHCEDVACTRSSSHVVDADGVVGNYPSIAIGADGLPLVSYYDLANGDLEVAHCEDLACSAATVTLHDGSFLAEGGDAGEGTSLAVGSDGLGLISYWNRSYSDLMVAHCDNPACTHTTRHVADADVMRNYEVSRTSIAIGADGLGVIVYQDPMNGDLKVARCGVVIC
jgi:hypothetical protein